MKRAYQRLEAQRLRPLLEAIAREIEERTAAIERLDRAGRRQGNKGMDPRSRAENTAQLANHKRELRHAIEELEALGCTVDPAEPLTVLVPGPDGSLENGFELHLGETAAKH